MIHGIKKKEVAEVDPDAEFDFDDEREESEEEFLNEEEAEDSEYLENEIRYYIAKYILIYISYLKGSLTNKIWNTQLFQIPPSI